jgi:dihydrofolate synthase/folylpolyglutamate synthase
LALAFAFLAVIPEGNLLQSAKLEAMTYEQALQKLAALGPEMRTTATGEPRKFSLDHIRILLQHLGNPQQSFKSVLIAGTNGKGSTAATLAAISTAAGIKTALYTSPHLLRVNERMRISLDGKLADIPDEAFARNFALVDAAATELVSGGELPHMPSHFEVVTAVAFCWFAEQKIDLAILEVGLGGRLDATNSVEPLVSVITDIGIDHTEYLGNTLHEIATEKAGILREDGILVTLSQHPEANAAIGEKAMALNVRGVDAARCLPGSFGPSLNIPNPNSVILSEARSAQPKDPATSSITPTASPISTTTLLPRNRYDIAIDGEALTVDSPLAGQHQQRNVALAIATAIELRSNHGFTIPNAAIESGIRNTDWPGRLEWIASRHGHAPVLLDVAHNPAGAWTLRAALANLPDDMPRTLIFSCLRDKAIDEMARVLLPLFDATSSDPARAHDHVILAPIQNARAATVEELLAAAHKLDVPAHAAPHLPAALAQAEAITPPNGLIVATGSLFLVGELRALLMAEPG